MTVQHREPGSAHRNQANRVYQRILGTSAARGRYIALGSGRRTHVVEVGDGPPVVFLHGSSTSSLSFLTRDVRGADGERCLLERLDGMQAIAVDRPGFGLSDPMPVPRERFRDGAVGFVDEILDKLGLETCALAGSSMGGTWALWYALAHPTRVRRLVLLGAAPLLPGTRLPVAPRLMSAPVIGDLLTRVVKPDARMAVRLLSAMGEKDTIARYPDLVEAVVAGGRDPVASAANLAELRAIISPAGFRRSSRLRSDELRRLTVPTLLIWGDRDPVGGVEVAHAAARLLPHADLQVLPAGHVPWLGQPNQVAELVTNFVRFGNEE